jgi:hypothetical protein
LRSCYLRWGQDLFHPRPIRCPKAKFKRTGVAYSVLDDVMQLVELGAKI